MITGENFDSDNSLWEVRLFIDVRRRRHAVRGRMRECR